MRLEQLSLTNFRGFESLEISFDPSFTVLLGENMAGKTAVLEGITAGLSPTLTWVNKASRHSVDDDDVRRVVREIAGVPDLQSQLPLVIKVRARFREVGKSELLAWSLVKSDAGTAKVEPAFPITGLLHKLGDAPEVVDLPVVNYYGTRRMWHPKVTPEDVRGVGSRVDGYAGSFDVISTHKTLAGWMRKQTLVQLQRGNGYVQPQLAAVEAAVKACIPDVKRLWFDVQYDELRLERSGVGILSFSMLSEGYRNIVALVADIAWRGAVLNPQYGEEANLLTDGVVLIDELDLHLHPAWQRRIVGDLRRTFPKIQFIVTTHSPQIVASVSREQVRVLDNNRLVDVDLHVEGRDTNELLEDVFGVPSRPENVRAEIDALYRSIEDERFEDARAQLASLQERLGPDDAAMVRARWILDSESLPSERAAEHP